MVDSGPVKHLQTPDSQFPEHFHIQSKHGTKVGAFPICIGQVGEGGDQLPAIAMELEHAEHLQTPSRNVTMSYDLKPVKGNVAPGERI